MTDRDVIRSLIDLQTDEYTERASSITVWGGVKFLFTAEGQIKSIIREGRGYGENGLKYQERKPARI